MSTATGEKVLCIPAHSLNHFCDAQRRLYKPADPSFFPAEIASFNQIINLANSTVDNAPVALERSICETDNRFRQLVAYCVLHVNGQILNYRRGKSGGESRLHDQRSIGIGGHINNDDIIGPMTRANLLESINREFAEELLIYGINSNVPEANSDNVFIDVPRYRGLILDSDRAVDQVHAGLVFEVAATCAGHIHPSAIFASREHCIEDIQYSHLKTIQDNRAQYERWSAILIANVHFPFRTFF